ncbi:lysozyme inhibitor LprI family protein [Marivita sp. S2033]|uniref:lysozyme inhibitor LprI family protein n=1 Tax=Marivita sp. S2033 TaxID=3373187 RepID=UPI0039824518
MRQVLFAAALLACPQLGLAQELGVDRTYVRGCFAATEVGEIYPSCLGQAATACQALPGGSTTIGISECIQAETVEWDAVLNEEYKATQSALADMDRQGVIAGMVRTDALRDAQRAWIAFRDADCGARYAIWQDGTLRTIVGANCHLTMTAQRALELRDMRGQ